MNRFHIVVDGEFINKSIIKYCVNTSLAYVTRAKNNTIFYDGYFKFNAKWLKDYLFYCCLDDFKRSSELDNWCKKHKGRPNYKYWTKIFGSNFGSVRVVAVILADKELTKSNYRHNIVILFCTNTSLNSIRIIKIYKGQRWQIEVFHRSLKQDFDIVTGYIGTRFIGLRNHYSLRCLSHLYLSKYISLKKSWKGKIGKTKWRFAFLM
jgi:hypothetical protein